MKPIWTARRRSWTSESSGFPDLESMVAWREARSSSVYEAEERLLSISFDDERIFFSDSRDRELSPLDELDLEEKKRVRFSYQEWLKEMQATFRQSGDMGQVDWLKAVEPDQVKLFASVVDGEVDWAMAWGLDLKNAKENFFPKYASIQPAPPITEVPESPVEKGQSPHHSGQPNDPPPKGLDFERAEAAASLDRETNRSTSTTRIAYVERETQTFEEHFLKHRFVYTSCALFIFTLGLVHALIYRW